MGRPWLATYPENVPAEINPTMYSSLLEPIDAAVGRFAERIAFVCGDETLTFAHFAERSKALARFLMQECALDVGNRVAVMLPNNLAFPVTLTGVLRAGGVQVNINPLYTARELRHQLVDSGSTILIVDASVIPVVEAAIEGTEVVKVIFVGNADIADFQKKHTLACISFDEAIEIGKSANELPERLLSRTDLALLQYTGGTTGVSKGAELTHGNLTSNLLQTLAFLRTTVRDQEETIVTAIPLYHIFALTVNLLTFLVVGGKNVLVTNPRDTAQLDAAFRNNHVTVFTGVNTLFNGLLSIPSLKSLDLSTIKLALGGGSAVQRVVSDKWYSRTGRHIVEGYGLSETSPVLTMNLPTGLQFSGAVGIPVPSTEVSIRDSNGMQVKNGEVGEIYVRGPQVMRGYWRRLAETADVMTPDGFFRTGDGGFLDDRGYLTIADRIKDMVIVSGFNVYPNEVEAVISQIPDVFESAVVGIPDEVTGEAVKAFVVSRSANVTEEKVIEVCRANLAAYKVPKHIEFILEIPKSTVGKLLRRELRNRG
ncbi:MAG: AMP-binding protein [Betaproteobacteria bacterium]|nr:AMP-binding protein [Betaproteobacteria bacterium]